MATTHGMIDLETIDVTPSAIVLSIGGVKFDPNGDKIYDGFHYRVDVDAQEQKGRTSSPDTLEWWGKQDNAVIEAAFGDEDRVSVEFMLDELKKWAVGVDKMWAQGVAFDMPIIEDLCRQNNKPYPWAFWNVRDSRTLFGIMPKDPRKQFKFDAHNALEDCKVQAQCVQYTLKELNLTIR